MDNDNDTITPDSNVDIISFEAVPDSDLMKNFKLGRPRDSRYDAIVQTAFDTEEAQRAVIPEWKVDDVVRGIKRSAKYLGFSVSHTGYTHPDDDNLVVFEFIAYPTHKRSSCGKASKASKAGNSEGDAYIDKTNNSDDDNVLC